MCKHKILTYFPRPEVDKPMPRPRAPAIRGRLQNRTSKNSRITNANAMTNRMRRDAFVPASFADLLGIKRIKGRRGKSEQAEGKIELTEALDLSREKRE